MSDPFGGLSTLLGQPKYPPANSYYWEHHPGPDPGESPTRVWHRKAIVDTGSAVSDWFPYPDQAIEAAWAQALRLGWTRPRWWQFWRWSEKNRNPPEATEMVGDTGIEPVTSAMSTRRSPAELIARFGTIEPERFRALTTTARR